LLRFFRFWRAIGGHANDGDLLRRAFRLANEEAFAEVHRCLIIDPPDETRGFTL